MMTINPKIDRGNAHQRDDLVCYCFHYTRADIEDDFLKQRRSLIEEKIALEKRAGRCRCASENPSGG